eukprot:gnl/TRDRNA2_/TRDRNA2_193028_c0_seq1.p1 gnl/TRDRNA2_/TRDRNA2_193028_c0~~gnl/TRDRNA2_/TRDRNA2_193028_c0_seq1.p1  ORF type:complete len:330 (+),score=62.85 gnl/TRDRNA2_/TRDRNA2_193028_c0_seq1:94-990(+)
MSASSSAASPVKQGGNMIHDDEVRFVINLLTGEQAITVSMKASDSVRVLKRRIEQTDGTHHGEMRLVAGTSVLSNRQSLSEVKELYGETLQLVKVPPSVRVMEVEDEVGDVGVLILKEDKNYEPPEDEVDDYSEWLGMDPEEDQKYLWIAREGLNCPVPHPWRVCQTADGDLFYFNFQTSESLWDHPCDEHYKNLFKTLKENDKKHRKPVPPSVPRTSSSFHRVRLEALLTRARQKSHACTGDVSSQKPECDRHGSRFSRGGEESESEESSCSSSSDGSSNSSSSSSSDSSNHPSFEM